MPKSQTGQELEKWFDRYVYYFYQSLLVDDRDKEKLTIFSFGEQIATLGISFNKDTVFLKNREEAFLIASTEDSQIKYNLYSVVTASIIFFYVLDYVENNIISEKDIEA